MPKLRIPVKAITLTLALAILLLIAAHSLVVLHYKVGFDLPVELIDRFHLDREANLPTWFSSSLYLLLALAFALLAALERRLPGGGRPHPAYLTGLALLFAFISLDETARLHELFDTLTKVKWVYVAAPFVLLLAGLYGRYFILLRKDAPQFRRGVLLGLGLAVLGGVVVELIPHYFALPYALGQIEYVLEEGLEMTGALIMLAAALGQVNRNLERLGA
mgnify:FL=1